MGQRRRETATLCPLLANVQATHRRHALAGELVGPARLHILHQIARVDGRAPDTTRQVGLHVLVHSLVHVAGTAEDLARIRENLPGAARDGRRAVVVLDRRRLERLAVNILRPPAGETLPHCDVIHARALRSAE